MSKISVGLRYMAESAFWFSIMSVLVKWAGETVPFQEIVLARTVVAFLLSYGMLRFEGVNVWGERKDLLILRGLLGFGGLCCFYYSVTSIPLADATVIQYTNPVFVGLLAALLLSEKLNYKIVMSALAALAGVALIAQPSFIFGGDGTRLELFDVGVALAGALFSAGAYTTVRKLGQTEHPVVVVFWFPMVSFPLILPWAISTGYIPNLTELALLCGVGVSTQFAQVRMTQGLKLEEAARATAMTYLQVVFAFVWGMLLFDEFPTTWAFAGATVVLISTWFVTRVRKAAKSSK